MIRAPLSMQAEARALGERVRMARQQGRTCAVCRTQPVTTIIDSETVCGSCAGIVRARRERRELTAP